MIVERDELARILEREREKGKKVVFTNGCFDILHIGHLRSLELAREQGDILVVGLNSDDSVRRLKGEERPLVEQADRAGMLDALRPVDYVVIFEEDTPIETIEALRPDVHVKGGDYRPEELPEKEVVEGYGGKVVIVPLVEGFSTTELIERIGKYHSKVSKKGDGREL
jgi:rfaE bifunctional protein nucleotidyltransferase chain/domain